MNVNNWS